MFAENKRLRYAVYLLCYRSLRCAVYLLYCAVSAENKSLRCAVYLLH